MRFVEGPGIGLGYGGKTVKAWFLTEASETAGMGHLMRCVALAQALSEQYVECVFVVSADTVPFCMKRHDWNYLIQEIPQDLPEVEYIRWLQKHLTTTDDDLLILDSYQFSAGFVNQISELQGSTILFDDCNDRGALNVSLIINSAGGAKTLGYEQTAPKAKLCLGDKFRLLRQEFLTEQPLPLASRRSLTLVMGGTDVKGLSLLFLKALDERRVDIPIRLVTTGDNKQLAEIKDYVQKAQISIQLLIDCQDLASVFSNSLLTISAAGSTQFELLAMQCPSLLLIVADNQVNAAKASEQQGWCQCFDFRQGAAISAVVELAIDLWSKPELLQTMYQQAEKYRDMQGAARLLDQFAELHEVN